MTADEIVDLSAARVNSEDGILVEIEDMHFKRLWDHDFRIGVNSANHQAAIIVFE